MRSRSLTTAAMVGWFRLWKKTKRCSFSKRTIGRHAVCPSIADYRSKILGTKTRFHSLIFLPQTYNCVDHTSFARFATGNIFCISTHVGPKEEIWRKLVPTCILWRFQFMRLGIVPKFPPITIFDVVKKKNLPVPTVVSVSYVALARLLTLMV